MNDELTKSDIKKMEEEIEYRKVVLRKELLAHVKEARAHGDLSENFEYHAAKKEKNRNDSRIRYLERMIKTAKVIDDTSKDGEIGINNRVTIFFVEEEEEETYKIVTTVRGDLLSGKISNVSPLGKAIMGHKVGDLVHVKVDDRVEYDVIIKAVEDTTDDQDDEISRF